MTQSDKCRREENSPRPQRLTDEQPEMGQTRSESKDKRKSEVRGWGGGSCHAVTVAVDHDEIIRAASCELRAESEVG